MHREIVKALLIAGFILAPQTGCMNMALLKGEASGAEPGGTLPAFRPAESAKVCMATAESLEKGGKEMEAIQMYERARQLDTGVAPVATRRLANLFGRIGEFDKAKQEYDRALQQNPNDSEMLNDLGYSYYCRGLWDESEKKLRLAVAINPKNTRAWSNLGMALGQKGKIDESLEAFQKAVSPGQAWCNLGFILATQGKQADAYEAFRHALQLEPDLQRAAIAISKLETSGQSKQDRSGRRSVETAKSPVAPVSPSMNPVSPIENEPIYVPTPVSRTTGSAPRVLALRPDFPRQNMVLEMLVRSSE